MKKLKLIIDKDLRCSNCGHFKLYFLNYPSKGDYHIKCSNCNAKFSYSDEILVKKIKDSDYNLSQKNLKMALDSAMGR